MIEVEITDVNIVRNLIPMRNHMPASSYGLKAISDWFHFTSNSGYQTLKSTNQSDHLINPPRPPKVIAFPFHPLRSPKPLQSPFDNFRSPLISTHTGSLHSLQVIHWTWPFRTLWTYLTTSCPSWPLKSPQPPQTSYWTSDNTYYSSFLTTFASLLFLLCFAF